MRYHALLVLSVLTAAPALMFGQTAAGTLTGIVTDPSGAVIAGIPVVATHVDTSTKFTSITSQTGNYAIPQMPVGRYVVTVTQTGFKSFRQENVTIAAAQTLRLDVTMELGAAAESVTVTTESTLLQTESGALTHDITVRQINDLPVLPLGTFTRDPLALAYTLPGSVNQFGQGFGPRINGLNVQNNQYRVDGEPVTNVGAPTITTRNNVSPDAIQEVAIQSSNFNAEFGGVSAALINQVIKSGTNQYHGSAFNYFGNDILNSDDAASHTRGRIRRNDYGASVGGPVRIPGLYNGKDKTFFFFNWEQYVDSQYHFSDFTAPTVPTAAYRGGDFSGLLPISQAGGPGGDPNLRIGTHDYKDPLGNVIPLGTIFDPNNIQTVQCNPAVSSDCTPGSALQVRSPFVGNRVPATLIDRVSMNILNKYVPLPQGPNANLGVLTSNYFNPFHGYRHTSMPTLKMDQSIGPKARLSFTYVDAVTKSPVQALGLGEGFPEPITANAGTFEGSPTYRVNFDYNITPATLFHLGVGWQEYDFCSCPVTTNYNAATDIGLTGATQNSVFPRMNSTVVTSPAIGGLNGLGAGSGILRQLERHPSSSANVTSIRGNHTFKLGADYRINQQVNLNNTNSAGLFSFGNVSPNNNPANPTATLVGNGITWQPALNGLTGFTGNANAVGFPFANFLMGSVTSVTLATPPEYRKRKTQTGLYIQDTWRIRRNLTLDYGLRWDYGTYAKEDFGRAVDFSPTTPNPAAGGRPGAYIYEASCNCHFASNYPYAVAPRLGIAYTFNSKTVLRGGAGIAYDAVPFTPGGVINSVATPVLPNGFDDFKLQNGIPRNRYNPVLATSDPAAGFIAGAINTVPAGIFIDPNAGRPDRTYQWQASLQREITRNFVVEAAYVGNRNIWQSATGFQDFNAVSVGTLQHYGFTVDTSAKGLSDATLLNTNLNRLTPGQLSTLAGYGVSLPYSGYPTGATAPTVLQSLKPFPQFSSALQPSAPLGKSWYDSLQITLTKRFSHGLSATGGYTYSKNLALTGYPDVFNPTTGKDVVAANPPQQLRISFEYQVPRYKGTMPVLRNKVVSYVLGDWAWSSALYYQSAAYLGRPSAGSTNAISRWLGRGPGVGAQLKKNADGSYMNPYSVDWTDLNGVHHTDPLDINCKCFDPNKTVVINPDAWQTIPDATWTSDTSTYTFFRGARRPSEAMNFARNFRIKERYTFQIRMEFQNVFNRNFLPAPNLGFSPINPTYGCSGGVTGCTISGVNGNYTSGLGTFTTVGTNLGLGNAGALGTQRTGLLIGRFTF
jgi:hypothetical protein